MTAVRVPFSAPVAIAGMMRMAGTSPGSPETKKRAILIVVRSIAIVVRSMDPVAGATGSVQHTTDRDVDISDAVVRSMGTVQRTTDLEARMTHADGLTTDREGTRGGLGAKGCSKTGYLPAASARAAGRPERSFAPCV
jgi:hypothetical protein